MFAANTSLMSQIEDLKKEIEALKKENEARKKESVAIGEEQQKIHKWYKKQFPIIMVGGGGHDEKRKIKPRRDGSLASTTSNEI